MLNSIRIRLTLWFTAVLALVLIAFAAAAYLFLTRAVRRQTDNTLQEISRTVSEVVEQEQKNDDENSGQAETTLAAIREALEDLRFRNYQIFVYDAQNHLIAASVPTAEATLLPPDSINLSAKEFAASPNDSTFQTLNEHPAAIRLFAEKNIQSGQRFDVLVLHSLDKETELLNRFRNVLLIVVPLALILASFGGYFLARKSLSPVAQMSDSAANISATNLNQRLPIKNEKDELGGLATVFNSLLERLESSFEQQRRFMADASHELRTPLAIVRGESEVALLNENRPNAELRESLAIVHDESQRLTRIVEDLFTLARADAGQFKGRFGEVYLDEILTDCVRKVRVLAAKKHVEIDLSVAEMPLRGDEELLRRLFINLLDNAIKYNRENGAISVSAETGENFYRVLISDSGVGISDADRAKIFERFYRADKARSRQSETPASGAGLGLSIALWIAELHRGSIKIVSSSDAGSVFAVELPMSK